MSGASHTPTPWRVEPHCLKIFADGVRNGPMLVADIRGWGYLTGAGHGALGLSPKEALAIQAANAEFLVLAVNAHYALVAALRDARGVISGSCAACKHDQRAIVMGIESALKLAGAQP